MTTVEEIWAPRVGTRAARSLKRQRRYARLTLVLPPAGLVGAVIAAVLHSESAVGVMVVTGLLLFTVLFVLRLRAIRTAEFQAVEHCGLPASARKWVPVLNPVRFDEWLAARGNPGWPRRRQ